MTSRIEKPETQTDTDLRKHLDQEKSFIVVAGAGSGKTTSLVKALAHVGNTQGRILREHGQQIACITYTEIATAQIFGDVGHDPLFHVSTIHSFLWTLIKPFQTDIRKWVAGRIETKLSELDQELQAFGKKTRETTRQKNARQTERYKGLRARMANVDRFDYGTGSDYAKGVLGHDDIIKMVPALIKEWPLLRKVVARKYPYFMVDESQDTVPEVVEALKSVDQEAGNQFCLGFFGDPMQQIYSTGVGAISLEDDWVELTKPENFRSSTAVLSVINSIRRDGDRLQQTIGTKLADKVAIPPEMGTAQIFVLPSDGQRKENLASVRAFVAGANKDHLWLSDEKEADLKVLVLVHRMAANRLGFGTLYSALNDGAPDAFKTGLAEGTLWALRPFLNVLLPLVDAFLNDDQFRLIGLLRSNSPKLNKQTLKEKNIPQLLTSLKEDVSKLATLLAVDSAATVCEVLQFAKTAQLLEHDMRFEEYLNPEAGSVGDLSPEVEDETQIASRIKAMVAYFGCPANQLWGYRTYIEERSPYSTQHGIKGDEFNRVMVVLDDEEATYSLYSYEKLLGLRSLSDKDKENQAAGTDSVLDRTRRLFYVCCSRAIKDLVVVLFTANVAEASRILKGGNIFEPACIRTIEDLTV